MYRATYPHVGVDTWVDFGGVELPAPPAVGPARRLAPPQGDAPSVAGYREALCWAMEHLVTRCNAVFLGYNISLGSQAYGTLTHVPAHHKLEMPVAENLMAGLAIGLALAGERPVLFFERHDFVLNALDALVNHLDKLELMSHGQFCAPVIVRAAVGSRRPLDPGPQHVGAPLAGPVADPAVARDDHHGALDRLLADALEA